MTVLLFCTHQPKSENQTSDRLQSTPMILCLEAKEKSDQISVYHDVLLQNRKLLVSNPCSRITTCSNSPVSSRLHLTGPHWIPNPHPVPNRYYTPEEYLWLISTLVFILSPLAPIYQGILKTQIFHGPFWGPTIAIPLAFSSTPLLARGCFTCLCFTCLSWGRTSKICPPSSPPSAISTVFVEDLDYTILKYHHRHRKISAEWPKEVIDLEDRQGNWLTLETDLPPLEAVFPTFRRTMKLYG